MTVAPIKSSSDATGMQLGWAELLLVAEKPLPEIGGVIFRPESRPERVTRKTRD